MLLYLPRAAGSYVVVIPLAALLFSCVLSSAFAAPPRLARSWTATVPLLAYAGLCAYHAPFLSFAPFLLYDGFALFSLYAAAPLFAALALHFCFSPPLWLQSAALVMLSCLSFALLRKSQSLEGLRAALLSLADQARERDMQNALQSKRLLENQDQEIHLATLSERNRIARDMHDNVGHLLSRALLQTGALLCEPDLAPNTAQGLNQLRETLSGAMDSVRQSVHDLHDQSIDLYAQSKALCDAFTLCKVDLTYDADDIADAAVKHCFLAVIKEALSNIARHGQAVQSVKIRIREHPALYQLDIRDDGKGGGPVVQTGLGLRSIEERVQALGGNVHFTRDPGFRVFLSIPKGMKGETPA